MIIKTEKARWLPPLQALQDSGQNQHGWIILDRETWEITNLHSYADYGMTLETFTIEKDGKTKEIYSYDEGETFTFDVY